MQPRSREKILLIATMVCFALLASDRLIFTPLFSVWEARAEEVDKLNKDLTQGRMLLSRERELRKRWREMQRDALPADSAAAENLVLKAADRWTKDSHVNVTSFKLQWKQPEEGYETLECRAVAQGDMSQLSRFVYELERDPVPVRIDNLEITSKDENGATLMLAIQFSGVKFVEKESNS